MPSLEISADVKETIVCNFQEEICDFIYVAHMIILIDLGRKLSCGLFMLQVNKRECKAFKSCIYNDSEVKSSSRLPIKPLPTQNPKIYRKIFENA